jgi:ABC-type bacteriocin/lantibiotic exporter with double-glycine peptidase domain
MAKMIVRAVKRTLEPKAGKLKRLATAVRGNPECGCINVPYRVQLDRRLCGLNSALMVAEHHLINIRDEVIQRFDANSANGTDTGPMTRFLRANGMSVRVFRHGEARIANLTAAIDDNIPVIVSVRPPHYLVLVSYDESFFYVNDPSLVGNVSGRIARAQFRRIWTREALVVTKKRRHAQYRAGCVR